MDDFNLVFPSRFRFRTLSLSLFVICFDYLISKGLLRLFFFQLFVTFFLVWVYRNLADTFLFLICRNITGYPFIEVSSWRSLNCTPQCAANLSEPILYYVGYQTKYFFYSLFPRFHRVAYWSILEI